MAEINDYAAARCWQTCQQRFIYFQSKIVERTCLPINAGDDLKCGIVVGQAEYALTHTASSSMHDESNSHGPHACTEKGGASPDSRMRVVCTRVSLMRACAWVEEFNIPGMNWLAWLVFPLIGACIGYLTNWVAIKMLFHPRQRRFGMQGLIPRRQQELAGNIGRVVGADIVHMDKLVEPLKTADLRPVLHDLIQQSLAQRVSEWRAMPLVGAFITDERIESIRNGIIDEIVKNQSAIIDRLTQLAEEHIDVSKVASENIAGFDLDRLESVAMHVARTEFRAIEMWGALLGFLIGLAQVGMLYLIGDGVTIACYSMTAVRELP